MKRARKIICMVLCFAMLLGYVPVPANAEDLSQLGLCEHHPEHVGCAYAPAVEAVACGHQHETSCYVQEETCVYVHEGCCTEEAPCEHICSADTGCIINTLSCVHTHDGSCGYAEATDAVACDYSCTECSRDDGEDAPEASSEESTPVETFVEEIIVEETFADEALGEQITDDQLAADAVAALIDALPALETIRSKTEEEQWADYDQVMEAYAAYEDLTESQKALLPSGEELFGAYFAYFISKTEEEEADNSCGEHVTWELDENGTLTISGTGAMADYASASDSPWYAGRTQIRHVIVEDGVTSIGDRAFFNCTNLVSVEIADTVTTIGTYAFRGCTGLEEITIPASVAEVKNSAFRACTLLKTVTFEGNAPAMGSYVFNEGNDALTVQCYEGNTGYGTSPWTGFSIARLHVGQWIVESEPTCYTSGSRYIDCSYCDTRITETFQAAHQYVEGVCSVCQIPKGLTYSISGENVYITGYAGTVTDIVIPDRIEGKPVVGIDSYAFGECSNLTSVVIPGSVTSIGYGAFQYCSNLTSVEIQEGVTSIGSSAFYYCTSLTSVVIPDSVTSIGGYAFKYCTSLTSVVIPNSVTSIGSNVFQGCSSLVSMTIPYVGYKVYSSYYTYTYPFGYLFSTDSYTGGVATEQKYNYQSYSSYSTSTKMYYIPESLKSVTVTGGELIEYSFYNCRNLTSIVFPEGVTSIGSSVFQGCSSLTSIDIPESVTSIGYSAFSGCSSLTGIEIPEDVTSIGGYAFSGCSSLTSIDIPESVTSIGYSAFSGCSSLTGIEIPEDVTSIDSSTFSGCSSLTSITIPEAVTSIGSYAFAECSSLTALEIPESITRIEYGVFQNCSGLTSIRIPESVTSIGSYAFYGCSGLTSITIPESVTSIDSSVFSGCSGLTSITIPESVTSIGGYAFSGCSSLTSIELPDGITSIEYDTFYNCSSLTRIEIPDSVTRIDSSAFYGCSGLTNISLPKSVMSIGNRAFYGCSGITSIELPDGITSIEYNTFYNCSSLTSIAIPDSVTSIGSNAFYGCSSLTRIEIPDSVTSIGSYAFFECRNLETVLYCGTEQQKTAISIASNNTALTDALWHFVTDATLMGQKVLRCSKCGFYLNETGAKVPFSDLRLLQAPEKLYYVTGETISLDGISLEAAYEDGTTVTLDSNGVDSVTADLSSIGKKTVTVSALGKSVEFEIYVHEKNIVTVDSSLYPQSAHNYGNNLNETKTFTYPGAAALVITFSSQTQVENNCDHIYILDGGGKQLAQYTGTQAVNQTLQISGDTFQVRLTSDFSNVGYGYSFSSIQSIMADNIHQPLVIDPATVTCTQAGLTEGSHCEICGLVLVEQAASDALGHDLSDWIEDSETGLSRRDCSRCDYFEVAQDGDVHEYNAVVTPPTCTEQGFTTHTCSHCGDTYTDSYVSATGHTEVIDEAVAATCTETGLTEGKHCSVCNAVIVAQETVPVTDHTEVIVPAVQPTCTKIGLTEGRRCSVCNEELVKQEGVPALGHREVVDPGMEPTCTEDGWTEGKHCSVCNEVLTAQEVIPSAGHTEVVDEAVAATCVATGLTEGKHCSVCNLVIVAQEVIPSTGHTKVIDPAVEPTCTETGLTEGKHCSVCNTVITAQETIPATGHSEVIVPAVLPTCTRIGLTEGKRCSVCQEELVKQIGIPAFGHTEVIDPAKKPTCTEDGWTEGKHCSVCHEVLIAQEVISAGHTEVIDPAVEATCTETGLTEGRHCSVCSAVIVAQEIIPAGHTVENGICTKCKMYGTCGENLTWTLDESGTLRICGTGDMESPCRAWYSQRELIKTVIIEDGVTSIGQEAFLDCISLKEITLPNSIIRIEDHAFACSTVLREITLPSGLTSIGEMAFACCEGLRSIELPDTLKSSGMGAFVSCISLESITIPDGVTNIGDSTFVDCTILDSITLPNSLTSIGNEAFFNCSSLRNIAIPDGTTSIGMNAFSGCISLNSVTLPDSVTSIGGGAFAKCISLDIIILPDGITNIEEELLYNCSGLRSVTLPDHLENIDLKAFASCTYLDSITIPNGVASIGEHAFFNCIGLNDITFQGNAPDIGTNAFFNVEATAYYPADNPTWASDVMQGYGGSITWEPYEEKSEVSGTCGENLTWELEETTGTLTISGTGAMEDYEAYAAPWSARQAEILSAVVEDGVTSIGDHAFDYCENISSLVLPGSLKRIGEMAFSNCGSLTELRLPEGLEELDMLAFNHCASLRSVSLPSTMTSTGNSAFHECISLEEVVLPDNITRIEMAAFGLCRSLSSITLPAGLEFIGDLAFGGCEKLTEIRFTGECPQITREAFLDVTATAYYPAGWNWYENHLQDYGGKLTWVETGTAAKRVTALLPETMAVGTTYNVSVDVQPWNAAADCVYTVSNPSVLQIQAPAVRYFELRAVGTGTATVTITERNSGLQYSQEITVVAPQAIEDPCSLELTIPEGNSQRYFSFVPENTEKYRFSVTDHAYLTQSDVAYHGGPIEILENGSWVDGPSYGSEKNRRVTCMELTAGHTYLIVIPFEGSAYEQKVTFTAQQDDGTVETILSFYSDRETQSFIPGERENYSLHVEYNGTRPLTWTSGDPSVVVLTQTNQEDNACNYRINGEGTAVITVSDGVLSDTFTLTTREVTFLNLYIPETEIQETDYFHREFAFVAPEDGRYAFAVSTEGGRGNIGFWDAPSEADILYSYGENTWNGFRTMKAGEMCRLSVDGGITACRVQVSKAVANSAGMKVAVLDQRADWIEFGVSFTPANACERVVKWEIDNTEIASETGNPGLYPDNDPNKKTYILYQEGTLTITATSESGRKASLTVTIPKLNCQSGHTFGDWIPLLDQDGTETGRERSTCIYCEEYQERSTPPLDETAPNRVILDASDLAGQSTVWIDGVEYTLQKYGDKCYVDLPDSRARTLITYTYSTNGQTRYPVGMKVWMLNNTDDRYTVTRTEVFDDILQYSGMSIRVTGKRGIRMITSIESAKKNALTSDGLVGYTLKEYGTVIAWASQLANGNPLVLGKSYTASNYAYRKGVAEPVFAYSGSLMQYTNVLVNFSDEQCKNELALRPYMILEDENGEVVTIYGGIIYRSIGYIAYQNRSVFEPQTEEYNYIWNIIHYVYGDVYDDDFVHAWTPSIK